MVRLGKAVPEDDDVRSLLVQLDAEAGGTDVDFRTIEVGGAAAAAARPRTAATTARPRCRRAPWPSAPRLLAMPFTFSFRGTFGNLSQFFARMERFVTLRNEKMNVTGRLLRSRAIDLEVDQTGVPQHPRADRRQLLPGARDAGPHRGRDPAGPGGHHARGDPARRPGRPPPRRPPRP